jgi:nucleoside-diphosphate-sugar epimerase
MPGFFYALAPELGPTADWLDTLQGVDAVVHLAGRAHVTSEKLNMETEQSYLRINSEGTKVLAHQSAAAGVKHFVLLSSCHAVRAEWDAMVTNDTKPHPISAYGRSKLAAEEAIKSVLANSNCAWTILRPPLVYGLGNKANFGLLVKLVQTGIPLPLASVRNRRSFIYVENLVDLIVTCLGNPKAFGKTFLPSDGDDVSTPELIRAIARANPRVEHGVGSMEHGASIDEDGRWKIGDGSAPRHTFGRRGDLSSLRSGSRARHSPRLFPFPERVLKAAGRLPGLGAMRKLTSSLYVDSEPIQRELDWIPPFTIEEGLRRTLMAPTEKADQ